MFVILRVRGKIGVRENIERSMELLNLTRVNHCVLYNDNPKIKGMLKKAKDYITWGEISKDVLIKLLKKRGKVYTKEGKLIKISEQEKDFEKLAEDILSSKKNIKELNIKPVFRLKPPSKGYDKKGIKKTFKEGGVLGYRGENINSLLRRMI
ncbi:MAG: 50S ribosomal protein L30 [Candidatus ainarchaeum sp.]|nr:50S ribosomal protein L30 [Candidatus ainarchaeum sp.]MDD3975767.1 50S ribosomal protein L30 [Candidatus ainarchaeum sp.]